VESCGFLAQVSKAGLTNICKRGFYSTNLFPKSGKCRKNKLSQILPDIPYQTSMKPQQTSSPGLARGFAAKLVRGEGTSTKKVVGKKGLALHVSFCGAKAAALTCKLLCFQSCRIPQLISHMFYSLDWPAYQQ